MEKLKKVFPILAVLLVIIIFIVSFFGSLTTDSETSGFIMGSPVDIKVYNEKNGDTLLLGFREASLHWHDGLHRSPSMTERNLQLPCSPEVGGWG